MSALDREIVAPEIAQNLRARSLTIFAPASEGAQGISLYSRTAVFATVSEVAQGVSLGSHTARKKGRNLAARGWPLSCRKNTRRPGCNFTSAHETTPEEGFALIALVVAIFVILLFLSIAAPKVARDLRRERELEAVHRGNQYVRAIQLYYKKFGRYPASIEQLEKTNNIRFLRKQYDDPMTGKPDWRLILVGQNKTTVKGLFGQPLAGVGGTGIGSGIGGTSTPGTAIGGSGSSIGGTSSTFGGSGNGASGTSTGSSTFGTTGSTGSSFGSTAGSTAGSATGSTGIGSQSATDFKGAAGPFMGVGNSNAGDSIITLNEQNDYSKWEFLYDPRIEQLKAKSSLFGGGGATSATSPALGSSFGNSKGSSATPGSTFGTSTTNPTTPPQP